MVKPKLLGALLMCSGIFTAGLAVADETSACAALFDPDTRDRATDVFVSIARLDENHACFLLPRTVIEKRYREVYSDRMPLMEVLTFEPADLIAYVRGRQSVLVGSEQRNIRPDVAACPAEPIPTFLFIASRTFAALSTVRETLSYSKEVPSDIPAYRRYTTMIADVYLADTRPESLVAFECRKSGGLGCIMKEDYDGMTLLLVYPKSEISKVEPEKARQCLRGIAELFRVTKPVQAN